MQAVRGAAWTVLTSFGARGLGLVGTLLLTYYMTPDVQGAVMNASIVANTAHRISILSVGTYIVTHPEEGREATWHVTVSHMTLGILSLLAVVLLRGRLSAWFNAPTMSHYLVGMCGAVLLERIGVVPERLLVRDLKFRTVSAARFTGELSFTVVSVVLATFSFGGMALVWGNVARSGLRTLLYLRAVDHREWLTPTRLSLKRYLEILRFTLPLGVAGAASFAARRWDNLAISMFYGEKVVGEYTLSYSLAEIPTTQVGEQIGDVLFPSFTRLDVEQRKSALVRSTALLSLVVFPLAIGLGAVGPTVTAALFPKTWAGVAPMLVILSALSVARPVSWTVLSYLQACKRVRAVLVLEILKVVFLLGCIAASAVLTHDPLVTCAAVGLAFALDSLAGIALVARVDRIPMGKILGGCARSLLATGPMALAVLGMRHMTAPHVRPGTELVLELLVGAVVYPAAAFLFARSTTLDFMRLVKKAVSRRRG